MRTAIIIIISILLVLLISLLIIGGTAMPPGAKEDRLSRRLATYSNRDKNPLGSYVPFRVMEHFFHDIKPRTVTRPFSYSYRNDENLKNSGNIYFIVAGDLYTTEQDVLAMRNYVAAGNRLFVAVEQTDSLFESAFRFSIKRPSKLFYDDSKKEAVQSFVNSEFAPDTVFSSKGLQMVNFLGRTEPANTTILGNNGNHEPNFFRIKVGKGHLFVLLNPMVWTNYFLLKGDNIKALENQLAYLPEYPDRVYWDEYYKGLHAPQSGDFSNWQVLLKHPALRWALWLAVLLLLLYVLFEGKRRQRLIPPKPVLANTSLDFAETLGRLYYLHHNNSNLAQKMTQHLLEYIRNRYYLNTSQIDGEFITALSRKSGHPHEEVTALIAQAQSLRDAASVADHELQHYYNTIYQFYLKAS